MRDNRRIDFGPGYRIYFGRDGDTLIVLLGGGTKKRQQQDIETGKSLLRDHVNATIGFIELGGLTHKSPKSLMRMLSPNGNPQARNLFEIIGCLQEREGVHLEVRAVR